MHRRPFVALAAGLLAGSARAKDLGVPTAAAAEETPTLRHTTSSGANLLFIGTRHTFAPQDPQMVRLRELISDFAPTLAFVEGGNWPIEHPHATLVERYGEMAFVARVARDCGATLANADPPFEDEVRSVVGRFGVTVAKLFYVLRRVPQTLWSRSEQAPEQRLVAWMNSPQLNVAPGMREVLRDVDELDAELRRVAPRIGTWQSAVDPNVTAPTVSLSPINEVARASVTYREGFITERIAESLKPSARVLLVMGRGHLQRMEPTFKARLASLGRG